VSAGQGEFMRLLAIRRGRLWSTVESERLRRVKDEGWEEDIQQSDSGFNEATTPQHCRDQGQDVSEVDLGRA